MLSGGSGKRLWPLSNDIRSKQFIKLFKTPDGEYESMVQRMFRKAKKVDKDANITIATSKSQVSAIHNQLGENVGICFQIRDDIFDYHHSSSIGKPTGNDMKEGKLTLPVLYALNSTQDVFYLKLAEKVRSFTATDAEIAQLIEFTKQKGGIEYAYKTINEFKEKASALLTDAPDSDIKESLKAYLDYVVDRNN